MGEGTDPGLNPHGFWVEGSDPPPAKPKAAEVPLLSPTGGRMLPKEPQPVLRQVGWLGHSGRVYPLEGADIARQEPAGFGPLYIQIGTWEHRGEGRYGIKD